MSADTDAETVFASITARVGAKPDVTQGSAFHAPGLKVAGRIFAMLVKGEVVLKLPADRCAELVSTGRARPFRSGGRSMKEWVTLTEPAEPEAVRLAEEALVFVRPPA